MREKESKEERERENKEERERERERKENNEGKRAGSQIIVHDNRMNILPT